MTTYFTSDNHFFHQKILEYCNRPFSSIEEMNTELIKRYNSVVKNNDTVYFLGDFAFTKNVDDIINILKQLKGKKHFICGNHDKIMLDDNIRKQFVSFTESNIKEILIEQKYPPTNLGINHKQFITLCHYPMLSWNKAHYGSWNLFGHEHGNLKQYENNQQLDVGVDCWVYYPLSFEDIRDKLATLPIRTIKHH